MDIGYTGKTSQKLQEIIWSICLFQVGSVFTCHSRQRFEDFYFSKNTVAMKEFAQSLGQSGSVWTLSVVHVFPFVLLLSLSLCLSACFCTKDRSVSLTKTNTISFAAWTSFATHPLVGQGRHPAWGTSFWHNHWQRISLGWSVLFLPLAHSPPYLSVVSCSDNFCVL